MPARFDNIVWYTDQELITKVHEQLPLFKGELPLAGKLATAVQARIGQLLATRGVEATVTCLPEAPLNQPIRSFMYRVEGINLRVRDVSFTGTSEELAQLLQAALAPVTSSEYQRFRMEFLLLPVLTQHGYLKAAFGAPEVKIVESTRDTATLDLVVPVVSGKQYRLAAVDFKGNSAFSPAELQKALRAPVGEPVNGPQLQRDLDRCRDIYGTKGYLEVRVKPAPSYDDARGAVTFTFEVIEGGQYRFRKINIQFPDPETASRLASQWELKPGDTYDTSYLGRFMKKVVPTLPTTSRWRFTEDPKMDVKAKMVDVTLKIVPAS